MTTLMGPMTRRWMRTVGLGALAAAVWTTGHMPAAHAANTISVCSNDPQALRSALTVAEGGGNQAQAGGTVTFTCDATIDVSALTSGTFPAFDVTADATLDGNGHTVVIDGANQVQLFQVDGGVTFTLRSVTLSRGAYDSPFLNEQTGGGAILNHGTTYVDHSTISGNRVAQVGTYGANPGEAYGGAINNQGTLAISNSVLDSNQVISDANVNYGGAIANSGTLTISNTTLSNNQATFATSISGGTFASVGLGGAIGNTGNLSISHDTFSHNLATSTGASSESYGGAIDNKGTLSMSFTTLNGNQATSDDSQFGFGQGGGLANGDLTGGSNALATVTFSTFNGNQVSIAAGRVYGNVYADSIYSSDGASTQVGGTGLVTTTNRNCVGPVRDLGGNSDNAPTGQESCGVTADSTAPTTSATGSAGSSSYTFGDWTNKSVAITLTASDDRAVVGTYYSIDDASCTPAYPLPPASCSTYTQPITISAEGTHTLRYFSQDYAGNADPHSVVIKIDLTPPSGVTATPDRSPNANGWYNAPVTVSAPNAADAGSGLDSCTTPTYSGPDGPNASLTVTCTDKVGNSASSTYSFKYDATKPTISAALSPSNPAITGWYNRATGAPTVSFSCSDTTSGINGNCPSNYTFPEGQNLSDTASVSDNAGNSSSAGVSGINVDLAAPVLNVNGAPDGTVYNACASSLPQRPSFAPTDGLSGLDGSQGDSWTTPTNTSGLGTYTYTAHAQDKAGNAATETRGYSVQYGSTFGGFLPPVGPKSVYKIGSTIPVKFQLLCNGTPISTAVAKMVVKQADSSPDPGTLEPSSTSAASSGNLFRYDSVSQQYIFNLSTKSGYSNPSGSISAFSPGTWTLSVLLDDGTSRSVNIQLVS